MLCWEVETGKVTPCNFPGEVWFEHPFRLPPQLCLFIPSCVMLRFDLRLGE